MTRKIFIIIIALFLGFNAGFAQKIPSSQVPSLVLNHFNQSFPKAYDVEWKIKNDQYYAEFDTRRSIDHEAWYDQYGKLLKHKEDISTRKIPAAIQSAVKNNYKGFRMEDAKKITTGTSVQYTVELKSPKQDWKVWFNENGTVLQQHAD